MPAPRRALGLTLVAGCLCGLLAGGALALGPGLVESSLNRTLTPPPYWVSARALALHRRLLVADLHADSLLWGRDLLKRGSRGQVDLPRLVAGGVTLQAFTVVTKTPHGLNIRSNDDRSDNITLLALLDLWPPRTWGSLRERALYQAGRLRGFVEASGGRLRLVRSRSDLASFREARDRGEAPVAALLGLEGAHALEGDLAAIDALFDAGFRMIAPVHFFDNALGGSAHGVRKGGLTAFGRAAVSRMERRRILVDLAHASPRLIADVLAVARRPVVVSHTGVRATCDNERNLTDEQIRGVAATGGVIGIGYWETAVCGHDAGAVARAIHHVTDLVGVDHVALGSDFDGAVTAPFDSSGMPLITEALLDAGYSDDEIAKIMGGNVFRLLSQTLP